MPAYKSENPNPTTLIAKMTKVCPYYVGKYVEWYLTPPDERQSWDDLCKCDNHFQNKSGENRTEKFCKENWLVREDSQAAIKIYMKHKQTVNTMKIYQKMLDKALSGDVQAAKYIQDFHASKFFEDEQDEINDFLNTVNIPKLKKTRG